MSDIQNPRPEGDASLSVQGDHEATSPASTAPGNGAEQVTPPTPPAPPVPTLPASEAAVQSGSIPASPAVPQATPAPPELAPVAHPTSPAPAMPQVTRPYPEAFAAAQGTRPSAHPHGAFGVGPQQTLPLNQAQPHETAPQNAPTAAATEQKSSGALRLAGMLATVVLVGGAAGFGGAYLGQQLWPSGDGTTVTQPQTFTINNPDGITQTTAIAGKVLPSVVTLEVSGQGGSGGSGSGVILSADGYVLTNAHVVTLDGGVAKPTIRVTTSDGKLYSATVVGIDPVYDLAVVKLADASGLAPIEFADSSKLNVGDTTIAIGAPLGLKNTVTTGIVSALNRSIQIASSAAPKGEQGPSQEPGQGELPFQFDLPGRDSGSAPTQQISIAVIQTDAAINPGNSGGALVNAEGKLIGINVAIATAGGSTGESGSIGVGFSIPSNIAKRVSSELIENGEATHGLLGATVQAASAVDGAKVAGAYIRELSPGGAAEKAGLKPGDIVTSFNGYVVGDATDLTAQVRAVAAGGTVELSYVRDGQTRTATVTLGKLASD